MTEHSTLGASHSHRWLACPGNPRMAALAPKQLSSDDAKRGTAAHWVLEQTAPKKQGDPPGDPFDFVEEEHENGHEIDEEDAEAVCQAIEILQGLMEDGAYTVLQEVKFNLTRLHPLLWGTADVVLMDEEKGVLKVIDYKHGAGKIVEARENSQLLYYALGAIAAVSPKGRDFISVFGWGQVFKRVEVHIIQPRSRSGNPHKVWEVPVERLDAFAQELVDGAKRTENPKAPLVVGDHCDWCPAITICPQFLKSANELAGEDFTEVVPSLPAPETIGDEQVKKILDNQDLLKSWLKSLVGYVQAKLELGQSFPGYKLVRTKPHRKWLDLDQAPVDLMGHGLAEDDLYTKKLKTPAQVEKLLGKPGKAIVGQLAEAPEGSLTIAPEDDSRPPAQLTAGEVFTDLS